MGKVIPDPGDDPVIFVFFKGGKTTLKNRGKPEIEGTWKVNPNKTPKEIDLLAAGNDVRKGLYQLDGDTLKVAVTIAKKEERPTAFDSQGVAVMILKRQKP
jgi:uncharacterized protein (TIGR03067 family)